MNVKLIRKDGSTEIMTDSELAALAPSLNYLSHRGDDQDGVQPVKREATDAQQATADANAATAAAEKAAADAKEATRLAARPRRSAINAAKAEIGAANSIASLRAGLASLVAVLEDTLTFQSVDVDEDE
jgi:hypothetical protein